MESEFLVFSSKKEYTSMVNSMLNEIKNNIIFTEIINKLLLYVGISSVYKLFDIHKLLILHLNKITKHKQQEWVDDVCWNIYKSINVSFDSLPFEILKKMELLELEKFLYKIIINNLIGLKPEGYLDFIEEKNIYLLEDKDLVEEVEMDIDYDL